MKIGNSRPSHYARALYTALQVSLHDDMLLATPRRPIFDVFHGHIRVVCLTHCSLLRSCLLFTHSASIALSILPWWYLPSEGVLTALIAYPRYASLLRFRTACPMPASQLFLIHCSRHCALNFSYSFTLPVFQPWPTTGFPRHP